MKRIYLVIISLVTFFLFTCATTGSGKALSLLDAIEQAAEKAVTELPQGSRAAIVAFESENENLSDFIMEELTGALFDRGIEVADRQNLEYVYKELNFQMSGDVSDETALSIGKFLGAELVITGQLTSMGGSYRFRASAIHIEKATRASVTRLTVRNDREMQQMTTAFANQKTTVKTAKYGVSEDRTPQTAGTFLDRGIMFFNRKEYEKAIADLTEAVRIDPNLASAYFQRGLAYLALLDFDKVIVDFTQAIRLDPKISASAYSNRGVAYITKGDYQQAISDFTQAIQLNPNIASIFKNRGHAYAEIGDIERAIADYTQMIKLNPNDAEVYYSRGKIYDDKGEHERAIADYTEAIRLNPNDARSYSNRSVIYLNKGDLDKALADCNQAIRINPNSAFSYNVRGIVYVSKDNYDLAIADFETALRIVPNDNDVKQNLENAQQAQGRANPKTADDFLNRGNAYFNNNDFDRAIADYNQAIRLNSNLASAYFNRGVTYYQKGDLDRAIADWETVLRLNPDYPNAKNYIEIIRKERGY